MALSRNAGALLLALPIYWGCGPQEGLRGDPATREDVLEHIDESAAASDAAYLHATMAATSYTSCAISGPTSYKDSTGGEHAIVYRNAARFEVESSAWAAPGSADVVGKPLFFVSPDPLDNVELFAAQQAIREVDGPQFWEVVPVSLSRHEFHPDGEADFAISCGEDVPTQTGLAWVVQKIRPTSSLLSAHEISDEDVYQIFSRYPDRTSPDVLGAHGTLYPPDG